MLTSLSLAFLTVSGVSCGGSRNGDAVEKCDRPQVVATIFPQYDFVRAVAGERVSLTMLVSPGSESHTYEPSIRDAALVADADLFIYTGGDIDPWASALADTVAGSGVMSIYVTDAVYPHGADTAHSHGAHDEHGGDGENEHVWTSPKNAIIILRYITDALIKIDPDGEDVYRANADAYEARLSKIDGELAALSEKASGKTVVVADRFPFDSLFSDYHIDHAEALGGCAVGLEPSASVIGELVSLVSERGIPYVFYIESSDRKVADLISGATGCGKLLLHSCHNVDKADFDAGITFALLMEQNVKKIGEVLS